MADLNIIIFKKLLEWLRKDDVEWPQILRLPDYRTSAFQHGNELGFSCFSWKEISLNLPKDMVA